MLILPIHTDINGIQRPLGLIPPPPGFVAAAGPGGRPTLAEVTLEEFEYRIEDTPIKVKDQNGYGACNGHAAATIIEWARHLAGEEYVPLSAWYIYAILCNGIDRGSSIAEALTLTVDKGVCPESEVQYGIINPRRLSSQAHSAAGDFKIEIGDRLNDFDDMLVATALRRAFNFSIRAGGGFDRLDSDGVVGFSAGPGNHAVAGGFGLKKRRDGDWAIKWQNSWTTNWGMKGFAWVGREHIERQSYFEAYDIVGIKNISKPPVVVA